MIKKLILLLVSILPLTAGAQSARQWFIDREICNHLDVGASVGTTGIGLNFSVPVTEYARVRVGVDMMPHFNMPMTFDIGTYQTIPADVTDQQAWIDERFEKVQLVMDKLTGIEVERKVTMNTHPRLLDLKFLVDVYPFKNNKHWHFTVGFHYGNHKVAHTENDAHAMPLLIALKTYNNFYDYVMKANFLDEPIYKDFYLDPDLGDKLKEMVEENGRIGVDVGKLNGKEFLMEPGKDGMVGANLFVRRFKPYLGVGYTGNLTKDGRWKFGFDAGVLFWGQPRLISHEQPLIDRETQLPVTTIDAQGNEVVEMVQYDLINDVDKMYGKVGRYVDLAATLKVYPVVNFKISFNIF